MNGRVVFPAEALRLLESETERHGHEECCGVLLGRRRGDVTEVARVRPAANVALDPQRRYVVDPTTLVAAAREARGAGLEIVGYYHSHPGGGVEPSAADVRDAWPDVSYVILSPGDGGRAGEPRIGSWRMPAGSGGFERETVETAGR